MKRKNREHHPLKRALKLLLYMKDHRFGVRVCELAEVAGTGMRNVYRYMRVFNEVGLTVERVKDRDDWRTCTFRLKDRRAWEWIRVGIE